MKSEKAKSEEPIKAQYKEITSQEFAIENPDEALRTSVEELEDHGGFEIFCILDDNFENLDPGNMAVKDVYLSEVEWKSDREKLLGNVKTLIDIFSMEGSISDIVEGCELKVALYEELFNTNLGKALERTKELEQAYWNVGMFFKNTNSESLEYFLLMNVDRKALSDLNDRKFFPAIEKELKQGYHKFDLTGNYSNLVLPIWLGSKQVVDKWGEMVHKYKATLITDYRDFDLKSAKNFIEKDSLASGAAHLQHVVMTYNQIVSRPKAKNAGEKKDMHISAAAAVAGLMYDTESAPISQPRAGTKYGRIKEASAIDQELLDFETAAIDEKSLVPLIYSKNSVFSWGNRTLFNGNNVGLQDYAIVKTFDWIGKVLMNFVTNECFLKFTTDLKKELRENIINFLNDYMGSDRLIKQYDLKGISQDPKSKDIIIDLEITPFFAAKNFHIKLTGHEGKEFDTDVN
ncbi:MAG TPA: hypothetical protein ENN33_10390 [Ignavibacteria bacterium]|nr:hypothetical protein [Ignavibacteria bacterium]